MPEVEILDEEDYTDQTDASKTINKVLITTRIDGLNIDTFSVEADLWRKGNQTDIIRQLVKDKKGKGVKKLNV